MKKLLACILALVMIASIFAGCNTQTPAPATDPTNAPSEEANIPSTNNSAEDLKAAAAYVKAIYKEAATSTPTDYQRVGSVRVGDVEYTVVWTVDVGEDVVKVVPNNDGTVTMVIGTAIEGETPYVLTASVSNAEGATESVSFNYFIPAPLGSQTEIVDMAYALEVGATMDAPATLTGVVTEIDTPYSDQYKNVTVIMTVEGREDKPIMCYRLKGDGAEDIMPGDIITVTGYIKNYKGTIEFDQGCTLDKLVKGENSFVMPTDPREIVLAAYALEWNQALPKAVTLTGQIIEVQTPFTSFYNNITVVMRVNEAPNLPIVAFRLKGNEAYKIWLGDTITVTGTLKNYKGTIEFDAGCTLDSWKETGVNDPFFCKAEDAAVYANANLANRQNLYGEYLITGRVMKDGASPVIAVDIDGTTLEIECYKLNMNGKSVNAGDYISVRGYFSKSSKGALQICGYLACLDRTTLKEAMEEASGLANGEHLFYNSTITGTIKIDEAYSEKYGNITFTVTAEDGTSIKVYRIEGYGADQLVDGDVVTVTGPLTAYKGTPQFDSNATFLCNRVLPKTLKEQLAAAATLANNTYLPVESTVTGTVVINTDYSAQYGNITFTVTDSEGNSVYCYRVKGDGMDTLADGDTVTVTGNLTAYNKKAQFDSTAKVTVVAKGEGPVTPDQPDVPAEELKTLAQQIAAAEKLASQTYLESVKSTITGTVEINTEYNSQHGNVTFTVTNSDGISIYCFRMKGDDASKVATGDTVTVTGNLYNYNGGVQFYGVEDKATFTIDKKADGGSTETPEVTVPTGKPVTITTKFGTADTTLSAEQAVWTQNGITITNDRNGAQNACYTNYKDGYEIRVYNDGSKLTIAYPGMTALVFDVDDYKANYVEILDGALKEAGFTTAVSGQTITVNLPAAADSISFLNNGSAQFRLNSVTVYVPEGSETPNPNPGEGEGGETGTTYTKITSMDQLVSGTYVLVASSGYAPLKVDGTWILATQPTVSGDKVTDAKEAVWILSVDGTSVTLQDAAGTFIAPKGGNSNGLATTKYSWNVTFADGAFQFAGVGEDTVVLASNVGSQNKFRAYKTSTVSGNPAGYPSTFVLYKLDVA